MNYYKNTCICILLLIIRAIPNSRPGWGEAPSYGRLLVKLVQRKPARGENVGLQHGPFQGPHPAEVRARKGPHSACEALIAELMGTWEIMDLKLVKGKLRQIMWGRDKEPQ